MAVTPFAQRPTCNVQEAIAASGLSRTALYKEMQEGRLKYVNYGRRRLISVPSLLAMLDPDAA